MSKQNYRHIFNEGMWITLMTSNGIVSLIRNQVRPLYLILGIFIPLIVTNCTIIARAEAFASRNRVAPSIVDGLSMGLGFTAVLLVLGAIRESIGFGTLFTQFDLMFGEAAKQLEIVLIEDYRGYLLAILPPGAFLGLGFLIALKNVIDRKREERAKVLAPLAEQASH